MAAATKKELDEERERYRQLESRVLLTDNQVIELMEQLKQYEIGTALRCNALGIIVLDF